MRKKAGAVFDPRHPGIHFCAYHIPHAHISLIDRFNRYMLDASYIED